MSRLRNVRERRCHARSLVVNADDTSQPLTINLRADCPTITVRLSESDRQQFGIILVLGSDPLDNAKAVIPIATQLAVSITLSLSLSPGSCEVFALSSIDGLEFANPDVMRNYPADAFNWSPGRKWNSRWSYPREGTIHSVEARSQASCNPLLSAYIRCGAAADNLQDCRTRHSSHKQPSQ